MKNFIILSKDNLNGLNGAVKFINTLMEDMDFWNRNNVQINSYSNSFIFSDISRYKKTIKYKIKKIGRTVLNATIWGKRLEMKYKYEILGNAPLKELKVDSENDAYFLINDSCIGYQFYKRYGKTYKTIFMMHNNGDFLSMVEKKILRNKKTGGFLKNVEKSVLSNATKVVIVSEMGRQRFMSKYPEYADKAVCIYNGLYLKEIDTSQRTYEKLKMIAIGTICKRKNQLAILQALKEINDKSIELTLIGGGEMYKECQDYIKRNSMENQVHMVGAQTDVYPYLKEANLFISASLEEGLPISAQEGMQAKLPLLLTNVGGCAELISENGELVDPDKGQIKNAIKRMNSNKALLKEYGERSYKAFLEKFTDDKMRIKYLELINNM